jgi:hypothetical protein
MDISYANLTQVKRQWASNNVNIASVTDDVMIDFARRASGTIDKETDIEFAPRIETRKYNVLTSYDNDDIDNRNRTLYIKWPLVDLTAVTLADSATPTVDTEVRTYPPGAQSPAVELQLSQSSTNTWTQTSGTDFDDIEITGIWCWRDRYDTDAWLASGDSVQDGGGINATVTSITVTDADGADYYSDTPRFDLGMMIRIGTEYMAITDVNTTTNVLTVVRGIRGSTAAIHANGATIDVFYPNPDIVRATQLIAYYNYARRGRIDRITFDGLATTEIIEIPREALIILDKYKFWRLW